VCLVGNDTGGAIAQLLAVRWPFLVSHLVLSDTDAFDNWPPPQVKLLQRLVRIPGGAQLMTALLRIPAFGRSNLGFRRLVHNPRLLTAERVREYMRPIHADRRMVKHLQRFLLSLDNRHTLEITHLLQDLDIPTLILWGCENAYWSTSWAQKLHEEIPGARLELIPFAGLSCHEEQPERFARHLIEHFNAE
jgi:pimeloyl-ACP methyl ester carboxylesterase